MSAILLIGAGRMGGALLAGWTRQQIGPVVAVEPSPSKELKEFARKEHIALFARTDSIDTVRARACIVALKPQVLKHEAASLKSIAQSGALMISIAAGTNTATLRKAWGAKARIVRAMPNTPGAIGRGITALFAAKGVTSKDKALAGRLLAALGETLWVAREGDIDVVTAVSGSGPAYVFHLIEALRDAAEAAGLPADLAGRLARATVTGAGELANQSPDEPAKLRIDVTSPGGTTAAALTVLMGEKGLTDLMTRAVAAATARSEELAKG